jgi:CBS domain-containing protein
MITAKDVMSTRVITIKKDAKLFKAIDLMLQNKISGLPVVTGDMKLVGIITEKDVLRLYQSPENIQYHTVGEFMTAPAVSFEENEPYEEICRCLIKHDFRRVPVTSHGKVVGIISRPDITRSILETISQIAVGQK